MLRGRKCESQYIHIYSLEPSKSTIFYNYWKSDIGIEISEK